MENVGDAAIRSQQERGEAVEEVPGGSALREALQRRWVPAQRSPATQPVHQERKTRLQMGGRRHPQEASPTQALSTRSQGSFVFFFFLIIDVLETVLLNHQLPNGSTTLLL